MGKSGHLRLLLSNAGELSLTADEEKRSTGTYICTLCLVAVEKTGLARLPYVL
jgi:hypothetical protein